MTVHPLNRVRARNGWSVADLAGLLGVTRQAVRYWETGETAPRRETQGDLADLIGVPRDEIVDRPWPAWLLPIEACEEAS